MNSVPITDADGAARKVDTITRTEGSDTVETQAVAVIDPVTGTPIDFATQSTVAALLTAAQAIKTAAEALNSKTTAVNTSAIAGTVALDSSSLAALEQITAVGPLTNTELRAAPVPVSSRTSDGAGNAITSIADGAGQTGMAMALTATNFVLSVANSSVAQLTSAQTFTGLIESIYNQQAVSVLLTSDQPGTLILNQYIDQSGTRKISAWSFAIAANVPFSRNFVGNGNFFNLTFQNTGAGTTTTLNINTAYGTLAAATNLGNAPLALNEVSGATFQLGSAAPAASLPVNISNDVVVGAAASIAAINTDLLTGTVSGWYDAANSHSVAIQIIGSSGITAGAIIFEQTNDITAAAAGNPWAVDELTTLTPTPNIAAITIASATTRMFGGPVTARYVRVRVSTAFATANVQAVAVFSQLPYYRMVQTVHQATAASLQATATITGYPTAAASADALANPTVTQLGALGLLFNGTTWDRSRNNLNVLTGDTGAKTASFAGATQTNFNAAGVAILINMGVVSGTTPTLTAQLQVSTDGGTTWKDVPGAVTPSITATGTTMLVVYPGVTPAANAAVSHPLPRTWRLNYTIGGTTPSFTITNVQAAYIN